MFTVAEAKPDKLRSLGIIALNGMFDEMDAEGVLRQAAEELLPGDLAIVSSFGADSAELPRGSRVGYRVRGSGSIGAASAGPPSTPIPFTSHEQLSTGFRLDLLE
jgi:hypothetical protein